MSGVSGRHGSRRWEESPKSQRSPHLTPTPPYQFFLLTSEGYFACQSIDLYSSLKNPFYSYRKRMGRFPVQFILVQNTPTHHPYNCNLRPSVKYHAFSWGLGLITARWASEVSWSNPKFHVITFSIYLKFYHCIHRHSESPSNSAEIPQVSLAEF